MGVVNSKYFISAWNEVIQSNGHNFWALCHMALKKKPKFREFYWLSCALNCSFAIAKTRIYGHFTGAEEKYFSHKNWKQVKHELVTWWSWYFLSNLFLRLSSTHAWFLHTLGAHNLMTKKTMTTYVGCVSFDKKQYSIFKGRFLPIMHTVQI